MRTKMRRLAVLGLAGVLALAITDGCGGPAAAQLVTATTHLNRPQQVIEGWGTSLAHWDPNARSIYETDAFRAAYRDLGLNILRVDMQKEVLVASPTDFRTPVPLGDDLAGNVAAMDFSVEGVAAYGQLAQWLSANALEPDRFRLTGSLWTPPHWMKGPTGIEQDFIGKTPKVPTPFLSGEHVPWNANNPIANGASVGGRLKTEAPQTLDQYGKYIAGWVAGFEDAYGTPFHAISLQNESTFENPFDSMTFVRDQDGERDHDQYALGLKAVKDAWDTYNLGVKIMGPHVANVGSNPENPNNLRRQDLMIAGVKNHTDTALIDFLDYYNGNFYNGVDEGAVKNVAGFVRGGDTVAAGEWGYHTPPGTIDDGKGYWYSETSGESADWPGAIHVALKMHNALVHGRASAYVYWQFLDAGDVDQYTLLDAEHLDDPESSKKYAAYKHFSRYVRPGATRLDATFANGKASIGGNSEYDTKNSLNLSAFYHETDGRLTYVLVNMLDEARSLTLTLPTGMSPEAFEVFRTSADESFESVAGVAVVDGQLTYTVPALSVTTLTALVGQMAGDLDGDGVVAQADLNLVLLNWGSGDLPDGWVATDQLTDGQISQNELNTVLLNWGAGASGSVGGTAGLLIPEPGVGLLTAGVAVCLVARRRGAH
ncbi:MAG: hypothetical protein AAF333_02875 [Planctomycetota bacterium]